MLRPIDNFFLQKEEPAKSCLQFLRMHILGLNGHITESWKYGMPFYYFKGQRFCYLWMHKKFRQPYLGIVEGHKVNHPELVTEKRAKMKILLIDASKNLPLKTINSILKDALALYK